MVPPAYVITLGLTDEAFDCLEEVLVSRALPYALQKAESSDAFFKACARQECNLAVIQGGAGGVAPSELNARRQDSVLFPGVIAVLDDFSPNCVVAYQNAGADRIIPNQNLQDYLPGAIQTLLSRPPAIIPGGLDLKTLAYLFEVQDHTPDFVTTNDLDGRVTFINRAGREFLGLRSDDPIDHLHVSSFYPPEVWSELFPAIRWVTIRDGIWRGRTIVTNGKGRDLPASQVLFTHRNPEGEPIGFTSVVRPLSESEPGLQADFRNQKNRLAVIINASPIMLYAGGATPPFRTAFISQNSIKITGYLPEEFIADENLWVRSIHPDQAEEVNREYQDIIQTGSGGLDYLFRLKNGEYRWMHEEVRVARTDSGEPAEVFGYLSDIHDQRTWEAELQKSEERYRILAEASPDFIYMISHEDRLTYVNSYACELLGKTPEELIGHLRSEFMHGTEGKIQSDDLTHILKTGEPIYTERLVQFTTRTLWLGTWLIPIRTSSGDVQSIIGVSRDISDRKRVIEELEKAYAHEKELSELKSDFIRMVSHEFRTPLSAILSSAELLEHYAEQWTVSKRQQHLKRISESVDRMTKILDDLFFISRMDTEVDTKPNRVKINLIEFFQELFDTIELADHSQHPLRLQVTRKNQGIEVDADLLRTVLENLLMNAVKYSPPQAPITVRIAYEEGYASIQIQDEGIGIASKDLQKIFEPFFRAENAARVPGTGLGLTIVRKSLALMGGTIDISSELGEGTTVCLKIPGIDSEKKPH